MTKSGKQCGYMKLITVFTVQSKSIKNGTLISNILCIDKIHRYFCVVFT